MRTRYEGSHYHPAQDSYSGHDKCYASRDPFDLPERQSTRLLQGNFTSVGLPSRMP